MPRVTEQPLELSGLGPVIDRSLSLLQFAAAQLWQTRDREARLLTRASYDEISGVAGALATHADAILAGFPPYKQRLVRTIFLHLVMPERTRALVSLAELRELDQDTAAMEYLVHKLADARLVIIEAGNQDAGAAQFRASRSSFARRISTHIQWRSAPTAPVSCPPPTSSASYPHRAPSVPSILSGCGPISSPCPASTTPSYGLRPVSARRSSSAWTSSLFMAINAL